ncbi:MAG: hypothetical protein Q8M08_13575 [Bacteroidales bacterium]|nr:hypothetical protein [Bacteroidales bacterium]
MNRTIIIILCLLIGVTAPCQNKKERQKNKIKSITEWETTTIDGKTNNHKTTFEEFDKSGRSIFREEYASDGTVKFKATVVYDSYGNKTEETEFDLAKNKNFRLKSKYNAMKDKTEEVEYDGKGDVRKKTSFTYYANGNKMSEIETDGAGNFLKKATYTYNSRNLKTERMTTSKSSQKEKSKKWEYVYY